MHYQHKAGFEAKTGYKVSRVVVEDGDEVYFVEIQVGGHDEYGYYGLILDDGPAHGERYDIG